MNSRKNQLKTVISAILTQTKGNLRFNRDQFEKAIMEERGDRDKRSYESWLTFLFRLEYITQPQPGTYQLTVKRLLELELEFTETNQTHLTEVCTHAHAILESEDSGRS